MAPRASREVALRTASVCYRLRVHTRVWVLIACLLGLGLGGCADDAPTQATETQATGASQSPTGESDGPSESPTTSVPEGPDCAEIWVDGQDLSWGYRGCVLDGTWVKADTTECESGQVLVVYDDRFYGAKGAVVNDVGGPLEGNQQYQRAVRSCG